MYNLPHLYMFWEISALQIRSADLPSQSGGTFPKRGSEASKFSATLAISPVPTRRLLPVKIVIGLSVLGRTVKQGVRKKVVSSCSPPESVNTMRAFSARHNNRPHYPVYHRHKRRIVSSLLPVSGMTGRGLETVAARQACDQDGYVRGMGIRSHGQMEGVATSPI